MRFVPAILANLILLLGAVGYGSVLRPLFRNRFSRIDRAAFILLGGLGLLGTLLFLIGQVRFTRTIIIVALLPALWGAVFLVRAARQMYKEAGYRRPPVLPAALVLAVLAIAFVGGLATPTGDIRTMGLKDDSIAYHFLGPRIWLRNGVVRPVSDECLTSMPAVVETLYGPLISFGGPRAPNLFAVEGLIVLLLVAAGWAFRLRLTSGETWWVLALLATMPVLYRGAIGGYVDAVYSAFVLAALRLGLDLEAGAAGTILFGLFGGFAMGTKYTGIIACALVGGCALVGTLGKKTRGGFRSGLKRAAAAALIAACIASPWYLRNWVLLGTPMYPPPPLLSHLFHARYMSAQAIGQFQAEVWREGNGMGRSLASFLLLPFHLSFHPANFLNGPGGISLAPLALAPFAVLIFRRNRLATIVSLFAVLQAAAWFVTEQDVRFLIPALVLAVIGGVAGWRYIESICGRNGRALAATVIAVSVSYGLFMIGRSQEEKIHSVVSRKFEARRTQAEIPFLASFDYLNQNPSVTKVLFLDPYVPAYYSQKDYLKPFGRWGEQVLPNASTVPEVLAQLGRLHVSDVLDVRWPDGTYEVPENTPGLTLVFRGRNQRIYRVDENGHAANIAENGELKKE